MTAFVNHFTFDFRTGIRNKTLLLMNYLLPLGFYALMGLVMGQVNPGFVETMIPAMLVFAILAATMLGLPDPLVTAREAGIFRSYKINGVPAISILIIPALTTTLHMIVVSVIITSTAPLLFGAPLPVNWPGFLLTFFLMAFACSGIGVLIGVISSSSRITVLWSQLNFIPSMLLSGMMLPYSMLPNAVGKFARILPATHAMNAFRSYGQGLSSDFSPLGSLLILLTSGFLAFGLAIYLFNWDRRNSTQRGSSLLALVVLLPFVVGVVFL